MRPNDSITDHFRPNPLQLRALERIGLKTLKDLLLYLPNRHEIPGQFKNIVNLEVGEEVTIYGRVSKPKISKAWRKKIPMSEVTIEDGTSKIKAVWFHQAYMAKKVPEGQLAELRGKVAERKGEFYLANPQIALATGRPAIGALFETGHQTITLAPVYPETRYLSSGWFYAHISKILSSGVQEKIADPIPAEILKKYNLPSLKTALVWVHTPQNERDAAAARKRFAFEEIFFIQLARLRDRATYRSNPSYQIRDAGKDLAEFVERFPFKPTGAQKKAINDIVKDFTTGHPMTRLLEGDVGSGKTAVAATVAYAVVRGGFEVAYMAPTEILAKQHFESFINYFRHLNVQVGLITGNGCYKFPSKINLNGYTNISRTQLLKWVANGEIPILVGTHALIQKAVKWKQLAFTIIDEQHRFGVMQRSKLVKKGGIVPHLLSMTATPIPRTLALTIYGDLDLTLLNELPADRKPIITELVNERNRKTAYEKIREELMAGRQAYVICPRIDEPDPTKALALQAKSAKTEAKRLQDKIFPEYEVGLVHSKLKPKDKEKVMAKFSAGEIDVLVSTSVVEVGVNVPNATVIIIEGAERFGLAQLHQLRGRVFRSSHQAYCFLVAETKSTRSLERLKVIKSAKSGFELAEMDLTLRGAGSLAGEKQWGLSDLGMEAIKNLKMVEAARTEAQAFLARDPQLQSQPLVSERLTKQDKVLHFE